VLGLPGKVRRALMPEEIEHHRAAARHYVESGQAFLAAAAGST